MDFSRRTFLGTMAAMALVPEKVFRLPVQACLLPDEPTELGVLALECEYPYYELPGERNPESGRFFIHKQNGWKQDCGPMVHFRPLFGTHRLDYTGNGFLGLPRKHWYGTAAVKEWTDVMDEYKRTRLPGQYSSFRYQHRIEFVGLIGAELVKFCPQSTLGILDAQIAILIELGHSITLDHTVALRSTGPHHRNNRWWYNMEYDVLTGTAPATLQRGLYLPGSEVVEVREIEAANAAFTRELREEFRVGDLLGQDARIELQLEAARLPLELRHQQ